jgi:nucleotide-binding universal stress UspA family protein
MKKILFPTDMTALAENAFRFGARIADAYQAEIITLHTYTVPLADQGMTPELYQDIAYSKEAHEITELQAFSRKLDAILDEEGISGLKIVHLLQQGFVVDEVIRIAEEENVDLIIMGTKGAENLLEVLWGTYTSNVVERAHCTVLSVPEAAVFKGFKKIAYATDFHELEDDAILELLHFAANFGSKVHFVHVSGKQDNWNSKKLQQLKNIGWLQDHIDDIHFDILEDSNMVHAVEEYVLTNDIDTMAVYSPKRGFWQKLFTPGYSRKLVKNLKLPVFVFKDK